MLSITNCVRGNATDFTMLIIAWMWLTDDLSYRRCYFEEAFNSHFVDWEEIIKVYLSYEKGDKDDYFIFVFSIIRLQ